MKGPSVRPTGSSESALILTPASRFSFSHGRSARGARGARWNLAPEPMEWVAIAPDANLPSSSDEAPGGFIVVPEAITMDEEYSGEMRSGKRHASVNQARVICRVHNLTGQWKSGLRVAGFELKRLPDTAFVGDGASPAAQDALEALNGLTQGRVSLDDPQQGFPYQSPASWVTTWRDPFVFWSDEEIRWYLGTSTAADLTSESQRLGRTANDHDGWTLSTTGRIVVDAIQTGVDAVARGAGRFA
ncbi:hypothetical protein HDU93_004944, partial [Gonapodya sp. JEL0774]